MSASTDEIARQPYFYGETSGVNGDKVGGLSGGRGSFAVFDGEVNTGYAYINSASDEDWFSVILTGGVTYQFTLSADSSSPGLDPYLEIRNSSGALLAFDDDSGEGNGSTITFTAPGLGTYYLCASGYGTTTGGYGLSARAGVDVLDSIDWGTKVADATVVNVYFAPAGVTFDGDTSLGWNAYEIQQVMNVLQQYENVCAIDFVITDDPALADLKLLIAGSSEDALGYLNPPGEPDAGWGVFYRDGSGWDEPGGGGLQQGGYGYVTLLHELGHGLGMAHPHDTGGTSTVMPGVTAPFDSLGTNDLNQGVFTVMSYNDGWLRSPTPLYGVAYGYEGTPMALDIALLQQKYGANTTYNSGDNTYVLPTADVSGTMYSCIWDTGGTDTIVHNGSNGAVIDLRAATVDFSATGGGVVSYGYGVHGGYTIAQGVVIENATGGSGNDSLSGNAMANAVAGRGGADVIDGREGDDVLSGGDGNDVLVGGAGRDRLDGGAGDDLLRIGADDLQVVGGDGIDTVELSAAMIVNLGGGGVFSGVENVRGSYWADVLTGDGADNRLEGGEGADSLRGGAGNDILDGGGSGQDVADYSDASSGVTVRLDTSAAQDTGGAGTDTLWGIEALIGSTFADSLTGSAVANVLTGGAGEDTLEGAAGDDTLDGGTGNDVLRGGAGDDTYVVDSSGDVVDETGGDGLDLVRATASYTLAAGLESLRLEGAGDIDGTGNSQSNSLTGNAGSNRLEGADGDDSLSGGLGDDTLVGGAGVDTASYAFSTAGVTVSLALSGAQDTVAAGNDTLSGIENLQGSFYYKDTLTGDSGANQIDGAGGDDVLDGGAGDDLLIGGGDDDLLSGGAGADLLDGGYGQDRLDGGTGADQMYGGAGGDAFFIDDLGDVILDLDDLDQIFASISFTLSGAMKSGVLLGTADLDLTGNEGRDILSGNDGSNRIDGAAGDDQMTGGRGDDTYLVDSSGDTVVEEAGASFGADTVLASVDCTLAVNLETLVLTGSATRGTGNAGDNRIVGAALADTLSGMDGDDTLVGGLGNDLLDGGSGFDTADYTSADTAVTVNLALMAAQSTGGAGTDTLIGIEGLIGSAFADSLTSGLGANILTGGDGDDRLEGGIDSDVLDGGNGVDEARYATAAAGVVVNLTTGVHSGDAFGDTFVSIERFLLSRFADQFTGSAGAETVSGSYGNDTLFGAGGDDRLDGGDGNDILRGGAGADQLIGGAGSDQANYQTTTAAVTLNLTTGVHTGEAAGDTFDGIERFVLSGYGDQFTGSAGADEAVGYYGNDILFGAAGADKLDGGNGNDILRGGEGADQLIGGTGTDTASYQVATAAVGLNLTTGVHTGEAAGDTFDGIERFALSTLNDSFIGSAGADWVDGWKGADVLNGAGGNDELHGNEGTDQLFGGAGGDKLYGDGGADELYGDAGGDILYGGTGADRLFGGDDTDYLWGEAGDDVLTGGAGTDRFAFSGGSGADVVTDFALGQDKIILKAIAGVDDFSDLTITTNAGGWAVITWGDGSSITLTGMAAAQVSASDVWFTG